ncbi:MAG: DUF1203 domain-containing protein [Kofleriaceae bacterium]
MWNLRGIDPEPFDSLFELSDEELSARGIVRETATSSIGFPDRVSMSDADIGDELLLVHYDHHVTRSPYRGGGAVYVKRGAVRSVLPAREIPLYVSRRPMSVRAYDRHGMMVEGIFCDGVDAKVHLDSLFARETIEYVHLHNARRGCFFTEARRL